MEDAVTFVAMGMGAFRKYNLNVNFVAGPEASTLLTTGAADIIRTRFSDEPLLTKEGQSVKIFGLTAVNTPDGLLAGNAVSSVQALRAMGSNCILAATSTGILYQWPNYLKSKLGLKCSIDVLSDYSLVQGGLLDGRYSAAGQLISDAGAIIADKKAHWIINPGSDPVPYPNISAVYMTTSSYLNSHKVVLQRFVNALLYTQKRMHGMSNEQIAEAIKNSGASIWKSESLADIVDQLTGNGQAKNVFALDKLSIGPVSENVYNQNLDAQPAQNVKIDPNDPEFAYSKSVDNSLFG